MAQQSYADLVFARSANDVKNFLAVFFCNKDLFPPDVAAAASQQQPQQKVVASWHLNVLYREYAADPNNPALPDHTANAARAHESLQEMVAWKRRIAVVPPPNGIPPPPPPPTVSSHESAARKALAKMKGNIVLSTDHLNSLIDPAGAEAAELQQFSTMTNQKFHAMFQSPAGGPTFVPRLLMYDIAPLKQLSGPYSNIASVIGRKHLYEETLRKDFLVNCDDANDPRYTNHMLREIAVNVIRLDLVGAECLKLNFVDVDHGKGTRLPELDFVKVNQLREGELKFRKRYSPFGRTGPAKLYTTRFWTAVVRRVSGVAPINMDKLIEHVVAPHCNTVNATADSVALRVAEGIEHTLRALPFHKRYATMLTSIQPRLH